ncbi:MAG: hypothetical protein KAI24_24445, partial [Planctomycetes bacterium]|nr:hypothetical protein [Planctomycetota bacterium]
ARNYFARPDAQQLEPEQRPQGRPGDEKFQPDVQALLDEIAQLPPADDVRLPPNDELAAGSPAMVRELLGICLYGLTIERDPEQRELRLRWIERLCAEHPEACRAVLDAYLTDQGGLAQNARLELLHELLAAGLDELVRQYDYVDDALLRSGFPEVLGTAAAAFRSERDYARLRAALDDLSAVLDNGGDQAAGETGNLDDPAVLTLLARTGGRRALGLLGHSRDAAALRQVMLACARELELPDIERLALELHAAPKLPAGYLQRVLHACGRDDFSGPARATSGELLCAYIDENLRAMPAEKLAAAIEALEQAPTPMTRRCLKRLSRIGRFSFSSELRAVRQLASQVLARIERRTSK